LGISRPYGSSQPDLAAAIPVDFLSTRHLALRAWASPGVSTPFDAPLSATHVLITQSPLESAQAHVIRIGPEQLDPATVSTGLSFVPSTTGPMTFAIAHIAPDGSHGVDSFTSFADFVTALAGDLTGMTAVRAIAAEGTYDPTSGVLTVNRMRSEEHTSELQSPCNLVCRLLLEKKNSKIDVIACPWLIGGFVESELDC